MMREEFYHSQYGDPDQHVSTRCHVDYEEGVEYIEAGGDQVKMPSEVSDAHESFLWSTTAPSICDDDDDIDVVRSVSERCFVGC